MSKRSISITTSSASRSHNHIPLQTAVASGKQPIPGILSISGLDLRPQPAGRKTTKPSNSPPSKKKPPRPQEPLSTSTSLPVKLNSQGGSSNLQSGFPIVMSHPSGRLARARAKSRSLSDALSTIPIPTPDKVNGDPFIASVPPAVEPQALLSFNSKSFDLSTLAPTSPSPSRRRAHKKPKLDRNWRSRDRRKESKHLRSTMKERVAEGIPSDSAPEDMLIDLEDVADSNQSNEQPSASVIPTTPPPSRASYDFPNGVSAPISVPQPSTRHDVLSPLPQPRTRNHTSTPSTPPRHSSIQPSATSRTLPPSHNRSSSHPFLFSASAPSSPSHPFSLGARYANSTFQHSPSPNVLPKPKFLESVFMEIDEVV